MKRYTALFGLLAVLLFALAACGRKQPEPAQTTMAPMGAQPGTAEEETSVEGNIEAPSAKESSETAISRNDIEAIAERTQEAVADQDIEALSRLMHYPAELKTTDGRVIQIQSQKELKALAPDLVFGDQLLIAIANVDTTSLEMGESGVDMGDELSWVTFQAGGDGELGITRINQ